MGPQRLAWVQACLAAAKDNPNVVPPAFDVDEFAQDFELANTLATLRTVFQQLFQDTDDTTMGVSSEAAQAADKNPGLKTVSEHLHAFFQRANAAGTKPQPAPAK